MINQPIDPEIQLIVARRHAAELREDWRSANGLKDLPCAPGIVAAARDYARRFLAELMKQSPSAGTRRPQRRTNSPAGRADSRCSG